MAAAVLDTSTLQALHRAGVLAQVRTLFSDGWSIPKSVESQTRAAFPAFGPAKVPDLDALGGLGVHEVSDAEREGCRAPRDGQAPRPKSGRMSRDLTCCGYAIDREEFDVVVLAKKLQAVAILDDHAGLKCAGNLGVPAQTTRDVLDALARKGLVADVPGLIGRIEATGYIPTRRMTKSGQS